jgi:adenine-specific DNA-methyltransferase
MSRLTDLLARAREEVPDLARDIEAEVKVLASRRSFGLNFERHVPEAVFLPDRKVRPGDKVVIGPIANENAANLRTWRVLGIDEGDGSTPQAKLLARGSKGEPETKAHSVGDLTVIAEFRDPVFPGLRSAGQLEQDGEKPWHVVINGENFHALEALLFPYEEKVDCIYIDPPYNTRDKDWKYNNDYVDTDDAYRHSKWLAMMERRLKLAQRLLNPASSCLIVTIDEREYLRLGLLLDQIFPAARIQMVSSQVNPANSARPGGFGRSDEYLFFVMLGSAAPRRSLLGREWVSARGRTFTGNVRWDLLRRSGTSAARKDSPGGFYPIYVDPEGPSFHSIGEPLPKGKSKPKRIKGVIPVLPIRKDGSEGRWQVGPERLRTYIEEGRVRIGGSLEKGFVIYYLKGGEFEKVLNGDYPVTGKNPDGSLAIGEADSSEVFAVPSTQWRIASHDSTQYGSRLLAVLLPGRQFPFPKSLYAVEDALRFFVGDNPDALVLDFFAGSGTTGHAVMRLNRQDGGRRRFICVTNNEVSAGEAEELADQGLKPGDDDWEKHGICKHITIPRLEAAITGKAPDGQPITGDYRFNEEFSISEGLEENVEFFDLTYEDPEEVGNDLAFAAVAPLLWLRAGAEGPRIEETNDTYSMSNVYGVLFNLDAAAAFLREAGDKPHLRLVSLVTDDESQFQRIVEQLPEQVDAVRLYGDYLRTFAQSMSEE